MQLITKVKLFRSPYTTCYVSPEKFVFLKKEHYKSVGVKPLCSGDNQFEIEECQGKKKALKFVANALFLQPFVKVCINSEVYRSKVTLHLNELCGSPESGIVYLNLILEPPKQEVIDYTWNDKILKLVWTRVEIENAFSWLSTLGGAYSALGDYFEHCADEAGKISIRQYKLSKMLGDDSLAARSRLYSALAYAQKGKLKHARHIVRNVVVYAINSRDKRLVRMCQGVWAKLKYLRLQNKMEIKNKDEGT